jgi:hypothetical protein
MDAGLHVFKKNGKIKVRWCDNECDISGRSTNTRSFDRSASSGVIGTILRSTRTGFDGVQRQKVSLPGMDGTTSSTIKTNNNTTMFTTDGTHLATRCRAGEDGGTLGMILWIVDDAWVSGSAAAA